MCTSSSSGSERRYTPSVTAGVGLRRCSGMADDRRGSVLSTAALCTTAQGDLYNPSNQISIIQSLRATATETQLEALKDLELDMDVRSEKAEIRRAQLVFLRQQTQLVLDSEISLKLRSTPTKSTPPRSPSRSPRPTAPSSPIYSPRAGESPIYSPERSDQTTEELEHKEPTQNHSETTYPPTRSGICPHVLQDWPRPMFQEVAEIVDQPTQKRRECTCNCH